MDFIIKTGMTYPLLFIKIIERNEPIMEYDCLEVFPFNSKSWVNFDYVFYHFSVHVVPVGQEIGVFIFLGGFTKNDFVFSFGFYVVGIPGDSLEIDKAKCETNVGETFV